MNSPEDCTYPKYKIVQELRPRGLVPLKDAPLKKVPAMVFAVQIQTEKDGSWYKCGNDFGIWYFKSLRNAKRMRDELIEQDRVNGGPQGHVVNIAPQ